MKTKRKIVITTIFILFILTFRITIVSGSSMSPTFASGQVLISSKISYLIDKPKRGDIIVVDGHQYGVKDIIKRVVGLPGDTVEIKDNKLYINGEKLEEDYIKENMEFNEDKIWELKEDEYFICGDNRNFSSDSREAGPITYDDIICKAIFNIKEFKKI